MAAYTYMVVVSPIIRRGMLLIYPKKLGLSPALIEARGDEAISSTFL
jgi:hypothetical protein